jgi:LmbE family N-acetylglucosaminyl deacetylase
MKKTIKRATILALIICLAITSRPSISSRAQVREPTENRGAVAAWRALLRLRSTARVLHTTAHPDDEDAGLLTWLARNQGAHTALLTLNRGEGGANLIGPELYDALGILRTEELLAAGRYYGLDDQLFTRLADFGFSKRLDETLEHWSKDVALDDVVRAIRKIRPDVIVSRFHGSPRDGHGNHQAAGLLTREAFKLAADPNAFPEHITKELLSPWQAKKLYLSCRPNEPHTLKIDTGVYDPLLGQTYRELASVGFGMHRSQSVGQARPARGQSFSYLQLVESVAPKVENEKSIFDGLDTSIVGIAAGNPAAQEALRGVQDQVEMAIREFDARKPWLIVRHLVEGKRRLLQAMQTVLRASMRPGDKILPLIGRKEMDFDQAVNMALGLEMEALVDPPETGRSGEFAAPFPQETFRVAIPGQRFTITASIINRSELSILTTSLGVYPTSWDVGPIGGLSPQMVVPGEASGQRLNYEWVKRVGPNEIISRKFQLQVPDREKHTRPYWSRASELRDHVYQVDGLNASQFRQLPFTKPKPVGFAAYQIDGVNFSLDSPVMITLIQPPFGEQRRLLNVAPAINISISPRVGVAPIDAGQNSFNVSVSISNNVKGAATGKVKLKLPNEWSSTPSSQDFKFASEGEAGAFTFKVSAPRLATGQGYRIQAVAEYAGREFTEGYRVISYRDLEPRHLYAPATMEARGIDVKVAPDLSVGYVMGVGDEVPKALEQIGVIVTMLGKDDLAKGDLDRFDAIVIGIRATAVRDDLKAYSNRLLDYAERGGNLVYQYQTQEFDAAPYGPYPYKLTARAEEVSEEDSKVTILDPSHPVFNWPNKITVTDFDGWVEERGSKWMTTWDERYKPLLECNDRGQPPQRGGLIYAQYGKGTFVYAAYAFYRQLPAGVQGGYRLFANAISLRKQPR